MIVLPHTELPDDLELPECPRWKVIGRNDLPNLVAKLREVLVPHADRPVVPDQSATLT